MIFFRNIKLTTKSNYIVFLTLLMFFCFQIFVKAQTPLLTHSENIHKTTGDVLVVAMPALSLSSTFIWKDGQKGTYQFSKSLAGTIALTYGLKLIIDKERPNGESKNSFPSGHTSIAFASASFIQKRYGWKFGIPAYLLAGYVGYSRIKAKKHDGWDVATGAVIGVGMSYLFTKPFNKNTKLQFSSGFIDNTPTIGFNYKF